MRFAALLAVFLLSTGARSFAQDAQEDLYANYGRYRLQPGDVVEVQYRHTPEFNQTVSLQPDGFVMLQIAGELRLVGMTVEEARLAVTRRSEIRLKAPEVALALKEFEKPSFIVGGEVSKPGRFDLRGPTTALEAIAIAGGFTPNSKHSQVLLVRRLDEQRAHVTPLDLKEMERRPQQAEEYPLRAGDMLIVPKNALSKVERIVKWASFGVIWNPLVR